MSLVLKSIFIKPIVYLLKVLSYLLYIFMKLMIFIIIITLFGITIYHSYFWNIYPNTELLAPNLVEPIEKGRLAASELNQNNEVMSTESIFWITKHRVAMQELQVHIEMAKFSNKYDIILAIDELILSSKNCETKVRRAYGAFRGLKNTLVLCGEKVQRLLENALSNLNTKEALESLIRGYKEIIGEIKEELGSILKDTELALTCLTNLEGNNKNVYRHISSQNNILQKEKRLRK